MSDYDSKWAGWCTLFNYETRQTETFESEAAIEGMNLEPYVHPATMLAFREYVAEGLLPLEALRRSWNGYQDFLSVDYD